MRAASNENKNWIQGGNPVGSQISIAKPTAMPVSTNAERGPIQESNLRQKRTAPTPQKQSKQNRLVANNTPASVCGEIPNAVSTDWISALVQPVKYPRGSRLSSARYVAGRYNTTGMQCIRIWTSTSIRAASCQPESR